MLSDLFHPDLWIASSQCLQGVETRGCCPHLPDPRTSRVCSKANPSGLGSATFQRCRNAATECPTSFGPCPWASPRLPSLPRAPLRLVTHEHKCKATKPFWDVSVARLTSYRFLRACCADLSPLSAPSARSTRSSELGMAAQNASRASVLSSRDDQPTSALMVPLRPNLSTG